MATQDNYVQLRLVDSGVVGAASDEYLHLETSIEVDGFSARRAVMARTEIVADFLAQLEGLLERLTHTAKLECGVVAGEVDVVYFSCQVDRLASEGEFAAQVSLGTAGSNGLLHRLHVALRPTAISIADFRHELTGILTGRGATAALRQGGE